MPTTFTSHEFILKLAQQHQALYIEALSAYRSSASLATGAPTMLKPKITPEIKQQADAIVARFNAELLPGRPWAHYVTNYRGAFLYLGHQRGGRFWPVCRLTYTDDMNNWGFAIYKYSDERYDPEEWFFPGVGEIDGTIEGAMRAGLQAYPS